MSNMDSTYDGIGAKGFNEEASLLSYKKSKKWKKNIDLSPKSNMKEIVCDDLPKLKDETSTQDKKRIGVVKRNVQKKRKISKASAEYKILMNENFMNVYKDIIEDSVGLLEMNTNADGTFKSKVANVTTAFSIMPNVTNAGAEFIIKLYNKSKEYIAYTKGNATIDEAINDIANKLSVFPNITAYVVPGENFIRVSIGQDNYYDDVDYSTNLCIGSLFVSDSTFTDIVNVTVDKTYQPLSFVDNANNEYALGVARTAGNLLSGDNYLELVTGVDEVFLFSHNTANLVISSIAWINLDKAPIVGLDYLWNRAAGYDSDNKVATGATLTVLDNAIGSAKFTIPIDDDPTFEVSATGSKIRDIQPMLDDDSDATDDWKEGTRDDSVRMPRALFPTGINGTRPSYRVLFQDATAGVADTVKFMLNGTVYETAVTAGTTANDIANAVSDVLNTITGITSSSAAGSILFYYDNNTVPLKISNFDYGTMTVPNETYSGINAPEVSTDFSGCTTGQGIINIYLNGEKFSLSVTGAMTDTEIRDSFVDLINQSPDYMATNISNITIYGIDGREPIYLESEIIETVAIFDVTKGTEVTESSNMADEYSDIVKDVFFDNIRIGKNTSIGSGCDMEGFCEVANVGVDLQREIKDIQSVCGEDHRIGWTNSDYTIYLDLETTDINAVKIHKKWNQYEFNTTFDLYIVSSNSGVMMYFPACKFEELDKESRETNHGHKYKVNVNFDPNKVPMICLPQYIV